VAQAEKQSAAEKPPSGQAPAEIRQDPGITENSQTFKSQSDIGKKQKQLEDVTLLQAVVRIQANWRGIKARRRIRDQFMDKSLNITNSFITGNGSIATRLEKVSKVVLRDGAKYSGYVKRN